MWRALFYICVLGGLFALAFFLPKVVQQTEGFQPLAETVLADVAPAEPPPPVGAPEPTATEVTSSTPEPLPLEPEPVIAPDLTPFVEAMSAGDFAKAAALLDLLKSQLPEEKYKSLLANVETARKREAEKFEPKPDPAAAQAQAVMLETLRQLQQSQKETAQMLVQMRDQKPAPPAPTPTPTPTKIVDVPAIKGQLPGVIAVRFGVDSSVMDQSEANKLQPALSTLSSDASTKVEIRGFADKSGSSSYNLGLSRSRATAVQDIFRRAGIADSRISLLPMGSFQAGSATTPEEAAEMRKVEVLIVK